MASGEGGEHDQSDVLAEAERSTSGLKAKKNSKAVASFFTPVSKKTKVAGEVEVRKDVDVANEKRNDDFQDPTASIILATIFDKKLSKKKAKVMQNQKKEVANASPLPDAQTGGSQPDFPLEQEQELAPSPTKKQSRASPAKKKRKSQLNVIDTKPSIGVHGPDLFLQARLAAEENARLSAGKATHPFFARPKVGCARSLVTDEPAQVIKDRSLNSAPDCAEKSLQVGPLKPPHPFFGRQNLAGAKTMAVDKSIYSFESDRLLPSLPLHVTQNTLEKEAMPIWYPNWTWRDMSVKADDGKVEGNWSFSSCQPSYTWSWPSSKKRSRRGQPISRVAAFGRVIDYLKAITMLPQGKEAGTQCFLGEEVESVATGTLKLEERFSSYYYPYVNKGCLEQNLALQPSIERQMKDVISSRNSLWTYQYQPQTSHEVCGNKESVRTLSSWLQKWGEKIRQQKGAVKDIDLGEESYNDDDSDFEDSLSEIDDSDDLHNCLLVTGPIGCGKSAAIYACAMEQGFTVIEVNASECRSGALIKHKFKEAMESHGLSKRVSGSPMDASDGHVNVEQVLQQGEVCQRSSSYNEESENHLPSSQSADRINLPPSSLRGLRVILFEDVDTVFEEDSGFMGALALLARTSKCPIIFSSNSQQPVLPHVRRLEFVRFEQPSTAELVAHAYMVCMAEGVSCSPDIVEHIVKTSGHDIRKLLMLLQFWSQESPPDTNYLKDASVVEDPRVQHTNKENSNMVNCLLQLDGCPQVPSTRIHAADKKHMNEELHSVGSGYVSKKSKTGICQESASRKRYKKKSLDSDWLYAYDCQHRVLPLLFPNTESCQLTAMVSKRLEDAAQKVIAMTDYAASLWSHQRFDKLKAKAEAEFQARKAERKLQAATRREAQGKACSKTSDDFSFTNLMRSSYDSPAAQTASSECIKDAWSLLPVCERSSSEEREGDFTPACSLHDQDMSELQSSDVTKNSTAIENGGCMKILPVLDTMSRSSPESGWMLRGPNCTPGVYSDLSPSGLTDLCVTSSQRSVDISAATTKAHSQSTNFVIESIVPSEHDEVRVYPLEKQVPNLTENHTIPHDLETPSCAGEQSCSQGTSLEHTILKMTSTVMEETWSELRSLPLRKYFPLNSDPDITFYDLLHDLSACDSLSSRTASASTHFQGSKDQRRPGYDDYSEDCSGDNCIQSAVVLAHMRLDQTLNKITPPNGVFSETWQVGPSASQQEIVREKKRALANECVDLLLPQRCKLSGRLARLDYVSFYSQLTPCTAGSEVRRERTTRQRKPT